MTDIQEKIKEALQAATQGLWEFERTGPFSASVFTNEIQIVGITSIENALLIANSPTWLSYLLIELDAAKQENERLKHDLAVQTHAAKLGAKTSVECFNEYETIQQRLKQADDDWKKWAYKADTMRVENHKVEARLRQAEETLIKSEKFISKILEFHGQGLAVLNWHQNGDAEPWDNFFDDNMDGDELEVIQKVLSQLDYQK